ncbi:MAG: ribonuclease H-like domain-containing protein [Terrimicrobiaceae bacterium]
MTPVFSHAARLPMDIVYFDLETQRTANDVGGWDKKHQMGMSVGVTYSTADDTYEIFSEKRAGDLVARLRKADLVVGYNILSFDYEVLMAYTILDLPHYLPTLDLLPHVEKATGHRLKLDDLAHGTLGVGKIAEGLDAIRWWREGKVMEIAEYCCFDVKVTRLVHEHGTRHGELFYSDRFGRKQRMEINWKLVNG